MQQFYKFLTYVGAIALVYIAQTLFKIKQTRDCGTFSWKELIDGLIDHLLYFLGALALLCSGLLLPDMKVSVIGGIELTTVDVLFVLAIALYIKQTTKAFNNIRDHYHIDSIPEIEEVPLDDGIGTEDKG